MAWHGGQQCGQWAPDRTRLHSEVGVREKYHVWGGLGVRRMGGQVGGGGHVPKGGEQVEGDRRRREAGNRSAGLVSSAQEDRSGWMLFIEGGNQGLRGMRQEQGTLAQRGAGTTLGEAPLLGDSGSGHCGRTSAARQRPKLPKCGGATRGCKDAPASQGKAF